MFVALYTSRIILDVLGETDYGIYSVVGGVVAVFTIISGSLSTAASRFITFELGTNNQERLKKVFSISVLIHLILALVIFILAESIGVWFLNNKMTIPTERMFAANWVLQCSVFTFMLNIISIPYNAAIVAHERMKAFAYIGILDVLLKLIVAVILAYSPFDKLIFYAVALMLVSAIIRLIYGVYCKRNFKECSFHFVFDKQLIKEMTGFAGWNFIGASSAVLRDQGVDIAINIFYGPTLNAARAVSYQVNLAVTSLVTNFTTALNPQITKSYANQEYNYVFSLVKQGSRFSFYLLLILSLPVLMDAGYILNLWLKEVPDHTVNFVRLILLFSLMESVSSTLITVMLATGKIRNYQIVVGGLLLLNFPISYSLLKMGFTPEYTMVTAIILSFCCLLARLIMLNKMIGLSILLYMKEVVLNVFLVFVLSAILPAILVNIMNTGLPRFILVTLLCLLCSFVSVFFIGCSQKERIFIKAKIVQIKARFIKK